MRTKLVNLRELGIRQIGSEIMGVTEFRLKNGLKILLAPSYSAPIVSFMQLFRVGSRDEGVGHTGATHFLEHMMFKGTRKFDPEKGLDSTELMSRIGAVSNATTWFDRTNYFQSFPSEYLEFCIKVESDRMRNLRLRQSDRLSEMPVVRNELERGENSPDEAMEKEMYAIAYREHPYHHPTIGWRTDVESVPMEKLKAFYDQFYWPDNSTVIVVGDFQVDNCLKLIQRYYGKITKAPKPIPKVYTTEPPQEGERRYQVTRAGDLARVWVGFKTPASTHKDHHAINLAKHILGGSYDKGSRLYKSLLDTGLVMDVSCRHDELRDPALLIIAATLTPDACASKVEQIIFDEIYRLQNELVGNDELIPLKSANYKCSILNRADQMEFLFALGESEARADWRWLAEFDQKFEAVTPEDILRVSNLYFVRDNSTIGTFKPKPEELDSVSEDADFSCVDTNISAESFSQSESSENENESVISQKTNRTRAKKSKVLTQAELDKILCPAKTKESLSFVSQVYREVLDNGLTLLHMKTPKVGAVAVALYLKAGNYFEAKHKFGLADVTAEMLSRGTKNLSKSELAQIVKEMGLVEGLNFRADSFNSVVGSTVVAEDLGYYLEILSKVLRQPIFTTEELNKLKQEWLARIVEQKNDTGANVANKFYAELYPKGHLYHQISFDEQIKELMSITKNELEDFHEAHYVPNGSVLVIVGDIEKEQALSFVKSNFVNKWNNLTNSDPESKTKIELDKVSMPAKEKRIEINLPEKASMDILMGYPLSLRRSDPDYYPLVLANLALGGDTIIARLGKVLREEHGLTYGIYSSLGDCSYGAAPWSISLTVNPNNANKALELVSDVLDEFCKKGISRNELMRESGGAAGLFKVGLRSPIAIAFALARCESRGLGIEELDKHANKLLAVKKSEVDNVIRKYLHPDKMLTVLAGTF